jgi:EmrB/QacA subfamily drug resistance transporter
VNVGLRERVRNSGRYRWWALVVLLLGFFSTGISITILTAVLPTIAREFGVGDHTIAWVVTGPMLVVGVLMPSMAKAGDLFGRKRIYLIGWTLAIAFSGLAALAGSAGMLIALRLLSAGAGAATGPAAMALILQAFPPDERVKAMGWWSFMGAGAPVIGLVIGGPLVDLIGWRYIFAVQPPLAVPGIILAWWVLRDDQREKRPSFDVAGSVLLGLTIGCFLYALNISTAGGWARPIVLVPLALTVPLGLAFAYAERRHPDPIFNFGYLRQRNVAVPMAVQLLAHIPYMGTFFLAPFLLHGVLHYGNARTALALMPRPLSNSLASAAAGYVAIKVGERFNAVAGMVTMALGLFVLAGVGPGSGSGHVVVALVLTGVGMGLALPGLVSSIANSVSERDFGATSAAQEMMIMIGMVLGMQGMQTIQATRASAVGTALAYRETFTIGGIVALVATVIALFVRSMHRAQPVPPTESPETPTVPMVASEAPS